MGRNKNEEIEADQVRVIHPDKGDLGFLPTEKALTKAENMGVDLVEVDSSRTPPICKLMSDEKEGPKKKEIDVNLEKVMQKYPFTIAHCYDKMKEEGNVVEKFNKMILTYKQLIRHLALVGISDYLTKENFKDEKINRKIENLRRPSLGNWKDFVVTLQNRYKKNNKSFFCTELSEFIEKTCSKKFDNCIRGDIHNPKLVKNNPVDAFIELRNLFSHGGMIDKDRYEEMLDKYIPMLDYLLRNLKFLKNYIPVRVIEIENGKAKYFPVTGANLQFDIEETIDEELIYHLEKNRVVLVSDKNGDVLPLYPFLIDLEYVEFSEKEICFPESMDFFEPIYTYDGYRSSKVVYLGTKKKEESMDHVDLIKEKFKEKRIDQIVLSEHKLDITTIKERADKATEETIKSYKGVKYLPEIYQSRNKINNHLNSFLQSSKGGLFIVGKAGAGKSSLMCERAEHWREEDNLVIFSDAHSMYSEKEKNPIISTLTERLGISLDVKSHSKFLEFLEEKVKHKKFKDKKIVLMIDAVNEAKNALSLLEKIHYLIKQAREFLWFKVVFTIRRGAYKIVKNKSKSEIFDDLQPYYKVEIEKENEKEKTFEVPLEGLSDEELEKVYERYKDNDNWEAPLTSFQHLPKKTKDLIRNPLLLKILIEAFAGDNIPKQQSELNLFKKYHEKLIQDEEKELFLNALIKKYHENTTNKLKENIFDDLVEKWEDGDLGKSKTDIERVIHLNPLEKLIDKGVLQRISEVSPDRTEVHHYLKFTHQKYFEFLLSKRLRIVKENVEGKELNGATILDLLEEDITVDNFPEYYGAIEILITEFMEDEAYEEIVFIVNNGPSVAREMVSEVMQMYEEMDMVNFQMSDEEIQQKRCTKLIVRIFNDLTSSGIETLLNFMEEIFDLGGTRRCKMIAEKLKKREIEDTIKKLRVHEWLSDIYYRIGRPEKALQNGEKALELAKEVGKRDVIGENMMRKAKILDSWGNYDQALEIYHEALEIEKNIDNDRLVGIILSHIGQIQKTKGEYDKAIEQYKEALQLEKELKDQKNIAEDLRNIGEIYFERGKYEKALEKLTEALRLEKELRNKKAISETLTFIGKVNKVKGEYKEALKSYHDALKIEKELNDKRNIAKDLNNIGEIYKERGEYEKAVDKLEEAIEYNQDLGNKKGIGVTLSNLGEIYRTKGNYNEALECYNKALEIEKNIGAKKDIAYDMKNIAIIYNFKEKYDEAMDSYKKALKINKELGNQKEISKILHDIGKLFIAKGKYEKAEEKYKEALKISQKIGFKEAEGWYLDGLGEIHLHRKDYEKAYNYFEESMKIGEKLGRPRDNVWTMEYLGLVHLQQDQNEKAFEIFQKGLELSREISFKLGEIFHLLGLTKVYLNQDEIEKSIEKGKMALKISEELEVKWRSAESLRLLGEGFLSNGDYKQAEANFSKAEKILQKITQKKEEAKLNYQYGILLNKLNKKKDAISYLETALQNFKTIKAEDWVKKCKNLIEQIKES